MIRKNVMLTTIAMMTWTVIAMMTWTVMVTTTTLQGPEWKVRIEADVHNFPPLASLIIIFLIIFLWLSWIMTWSMIFSPLGFSDITIVLYSFADKSQNCRMWDKACNFIISGFSDNHHLDDNLHCKYYRCYWRWLSDLLTVNGARYAGVSMSSVVASETSESTKWWCRRWRWCRRW